MPPPNAAPSRPLIPDTAGDPNPGMAAAPAQTENGRVLEVPAHLPVRRVPTPVPLSPRAMSPAVQPLQKVPPSPYALAVDRHVQDYNTLQIRARDSYRNAEAAFEAWQRGMKSADTALNAQLFDDAEECRISAARSFERMRAFTDEQANDLRQTVTLSKAIHQNPQFERAYQETSLCFTYDQVPRSLPPEAASLKFMEKR